MTLKQLQQEILKLKREQDVTVLAHYYQPLEIQEIADYLGDSLGLSRIAKEKSDTEYIIFAGVIFMAETASILNQDKHVLVPSEQAHCELAKFLTPQIIKEFKKIYSDLPVVTYVNTTASVKAESDVCCTSSNSTKIVKRVKKEFNAETILFGPDANLARYTEKNSNIKLVKMPENGHCYTHSELTVNDIEKIKKVHPSAMLLVHPECNIEVQNLADFIGSTAGMYKKVKESSSHQEEFIIGTEKGLLERLSQDFPDNIFYLAKEKMICYDMKKNNLQSIKDILEHLDDKPNEIKVPSEIAKKALIPIERMLEYS
jgi:quinolinate synthase